MTVRALNIKLEKEHKEMEEDAQWAGRFQAALQRYMDAPKSKKGHNAIEKITKRKQ